MPPKKKMVAAPIDRPLSRAYLRQFTGWSTAFPPGLSDPTSLRIMENVQINRDGSCRIRPGLRFLSYAEPPSDDNDQVGTAFDLQNVGTHEAFYLNDGTKAYLFAVREANGTVGFRVLKLGTENSIIIDLDDVFTIPQGEAVLNFTAETTYVKYLQIDNKVFALSNVGETLRLFTVGEEKSARKLSSIERPSWHVADKLTVVKPDAAWIDAALPVSQRTNMAFQPSFEHGLLTTATIPDSFSEVEVVSTVAKHGAKSLRLSTKAQRTNFMPKPLHDVATLGIGGWSAAGGNVASFVASGSSLRFISGAGPGTTSIWYYAKSPRMSGIEAGKNYTVDVFLQSQANNAEIAYMMRFYGSNGAQVGSDQSRDRTLAGGRHGLGPFLAPAGAVSADLYIRGKKLSLTGAAARIDFQAVVVCPYGEVSTIFTGSSGAGFFWEGAVNNSISVYQPQHDAAVTLKGAPAAAAKTYTASLSVRAGTTVRAVSMRLEFLNAAGVSTGFADSTPDTDSNSSWEQHVVTLMAPAASVAYRQIVTVDDVVRNEDHFIDEIMVEEAPSVGAFFTGDSPETVDIHYDWLGVPGQSASTEIEYDDPVAIPTAETNTADTLISSTAADNQYSFAYFYTFENEVGESAASMVTTVKVQRRWGAWKWEAANAAGEPNGTEELDSAMVADQLVAFMPQDVYDAAKAQGATNWNLYMLTWSDQDSVPPEGILLESKDITSAGTYEAQGWIRHTPVQNDAGFAAAVPQENTRYNYSQPSSGGQGLVASDRMILVADPLNQAVIRWSSNNQGEYSNFTAAKGGGYKTLTSGNLYVPVAVKLWQNPQSVDTITILCAGVDGQHTAYYMAPASVAQQSEQVTVMGFEETTATPGTTSPYGVEVMNNALWHPLDEMLMKSTASNYNISHKPMTDQIVDDWSALANKQRIVSSQHDNRLYYLVHNPSRSLEPGCMGNEIWIFDIASEKGTWSRWLVDGCSLRRIEFGGKIHMSIVRPDGIFYFDTDYDRDDVVALDGTVVTEFIPWRIETNTQGANRAHDAWSHLQQLEVTLGNFVGKMAYGIRGIDVHGKEIDREKIVQDPRGLDIIDHLPHDISDYLNIARDMREWFFRAGSTLDENGVVEASFGQLNVVQYRYAPISVNVGYEYGSVETFEYTRAVVNVGESINENGIPVPVIDYRRP